MTYNLLALRTWLCSWRTQCLTFFCFRIASIKLTLGVYPEAVEDYKKILEVSIDYVPALKGLYSIGYLFRWYWNSAGGSVFVILTLARLWDWVPSGVAHPYICYTKQLVFHFGRVGGLIISGACSGHGLYFCGSDLCYCPFGYDTAKWYMLKITTLNILYTGRILG